MANKIQITPTLAPLPTNFVGKPQAFAEAIVARLKFETDDEFTTFVISDSLPSSDQGPVLLGGTKWYVWDANAAEYIPLDISDSFTPPFQISSTTPATQVPPVWLRITALTEGRFIGWYYWMGEELGWVPGNTITPRGTTLERPALPLELERFYDTDINAEIWWERGAWRTVAGTPGDTKFVISETLDEALEINPGWIEVGSVLGSEVRGRSIVVASKDSDDSDGLTNLPVGSGITPRSSSATFGSETVLLETAHMPAHTHTLFNQDFAGADQDWDEDAIAIVRSAGCSVSCDYQIRAQHDVVEFPPDTFRSSEEGADAQHENMPPGYAMWMLVKT
jgi:hypothetical protein